MSDAQGQLANILLLPETEIDDPEAPKPPIPPEHGEWFGENGVVMDKLANSLAVGKLLYGVRTVDSVPDLWARPLLFQIALFNNKHPLHDNVRDEWRGLLTILALKERYSLPLYTKHLQLSNSEGGRFTKVAYKLCPTAVLDQETSWDKVYLFFYGSELRDDTDRGKVIGMASPVTLVCTSASLEERLDKNIPWFQHGVLSDPCDHIGEDEKGALRFWLKELRKNLSIQCPSEQIKDLDPLLASFEKDLENSQASSPYHLSESSLGLNTGLYQLLDKPVQPSQISLEQSAVKLLPSEGLTPPKTLLVLSSDLAKQWKIEHQSEVPIYGQETLASLDFDRLGEDRTMLVTRTSPLKLKDAEWRKPEDFFTEKLLLVKVADAFPEVRKIRGQDKLTYKNNAVVPILPIQSELLSYLNPSDLAGNITLSQVDKERIRVELKLPLVGIKDIKGKKNDSLIIQHTYEAQDIEVAGSLPILEIWPNFQAKNWNQYYTYYDPVGTKKTDTFYAKPYPEVNESRKVTDEQKELKREITRSSQPPTAMLCKTWSRQLNREVNVGCLLLKDLPSAPLQQDVSWEIGVDFGTSATNIYVRSNDQTEPFAIGFPVRLVPITSTMGDRRWNIVKYFLPYFEPQNPFFSLFRPERQGAGGERDNYNFPFLRGNIFYMEPDSYLKDLAQEGVRSRLKWQEGSELIRGFLEQLAVQCLAEAVANGVTKVNWYVSYPTVYGNEAIRRQETIWNKIVETTRSIGIQSDFSDEKNYKTESFTSAIFFKEKQNVPLAQTICIDIGGETSDISILGGGAFLEQCSVRFAGECFFMDLFKKNPSVMTFLSSDLQLLELVTKAAKKSNFSAEMDAILRKYGKDFLSKLAGNITTQDWNKPDHPVYGLLHLIALGLSGLFYYTGLLLNQVKTLEKLDGEDLPYVCVGGNGAWTLHWIGQGTFNAITPHNKLFRELLNSAAGFNQETGFSVKVSLNPKGEVAYGLVQETEWKLRTPDEKKFELSGENFLDSSGADLGWDTGLTAEMLNLGLRVPGELVQLMRFIEVFNNYSRTPNSYVREIKLSQEDIMTVRLSIQDILYLFKGRNPSEITVEPLFIMALKELLKLEINKWVNRQ
jgi:hypothetical protein